MPFDAVWLPLMDCGPMSSARPVEHLLALALTDTRGITASECAEVRLSTAWRSACTRPLPVTTPRRYCRRTLVYPDPTRSCGDRCPSAMHVA